MRTDVSPLRLRPPSPLPPPPAHPQSAMTLFPLSRTELFAAFPPHHRMHRFIFYAHSLPCCMVPDKTTIAFRIIQYKCFSDMILDFVHSVLCGCMCLWGRGPTILLNLSLLYCMVWIIYCDGRCWYSSGCRKGRLTMDRFRTVVVTVLRLVSPTTATSESKS